MPGIPFFLRKYRTPLPKSRIRNGNPFADLSLQATSGSVAISLKKAGLPRSTRRDSFLNRDLGAKIFLTKKVIYIKEVSCQYNGVLKTKASKKFGAFFCRQPQKRRARHARVESL
jgi:hypothetical protein